MIDELETMLGGGEEEGNDALQRVVAGTDRKSDGELQHQPTYHYTHAVDTLGSHHVHPNSYGHTVFSLLVLAGDFFLPFVLIYW